MQFLNSISEDAHVKTELIAAILILLSYSRTQGIIWGFFSYFLIRVFTGNWRELSPIFIVINLFAVLLLIVY